MHRCSVGVRDTAAGHVHASVLQDVQRCSKFWLVVRANQLAFTRFFSYLVLVCRWAVFFVFPVFMTSVIIVKSVVLFKRGAVRDKNVSMQTNHWMSCLWLLDSIPAWSITHLPLPPPPPPPVLPNPHALLLPQNAAQKHVLLQKQMLPV